MIETNGWVSFGEEGMTNVTTITAGAVSFGIEGDSLFFFWVSRAGH